MRSAYDILDWAVLVYFLDRRSGWGPVQVLVGYKLVGEHRCCSLWPAEMGGALDAAQVVEFVDSGRDLLMAVDSRASDEMRCCGAAHCCLCKLVVCVPCAAVCSQVGLLEQLYCTLIDMTGPPAKCGLQSALFGRARTHFAQDSRN